MHIFDVPAAKKDSKTGHSKDGKSPKDFANGGGLRNMRPAMETGAATEGEKSLHSAQSQNLERLQMGKKFVSSGHLCDTFCLAQPISVY